MIPSGCVCGERVSLGAAQAGSVGGGGLVTAFAELTKAGCAGEFYAGSGSGIAGRARCLRTPGSEDEGGGAGAEGWGASQFWESLVAAPGWTWPLSALPPAGPRFPNFQICPPQ